MKENIDQICEKENHDEKIRNQLSKAILTALKEGERRNREMLDGMNNIIIDIANDPMYCAIEEKTALGTIRYTDGETEKLKQMMIDHWQHYANRLRRKIK